MRLVLAILCGLVACDFNRTRDEPDSATDAALRPDGAVVDFGSSVDGPSNPSKCPSLPPTDRDPCDAFGIGCLYEVAYCACTNVSALDDTIGWDCYTSAANPTPHDGAACTPAIDRDRTFVQKVPYCMLCECTPAAIWSCGASTCADCPLTPPSQGDGCHIPASESCVYPKVGIPIICECAFEHWSCH